MSEALFNSTTIPVLERVAQFSQLRHQVLSGNIANLDTPGYETRDLSPGLFAAKMRRAIENRNQGQNTSLPNAGQNPVAQLSREMSDLLHHDQSNVSLEHQVSELVKNQLQHNLAMTIMGNQFRLLQAAISERA